MSVVDDIQTLSSEMLGMPAVCIAILDGPVDRSHPCLDRANLTQLTTLVPGQADPNGQMSLHGTHIANILHYQTWFTVNRLL